MKKELNYSKLAGTEHLKTFGQYFTNAEVASFMCSWACDGASTMLDPAVGNSTFLINAQKQYPECMLTGYEIDSTILDFFGNPAAADIKNEDYLLNGWDETYDAIVCNPPYNRFQSVTNRKDILTTIYENIGVKYSSYTNLYILFLLKSLFQLSSKGRLAYIIPTEFLNSQYGTPIKEKLLNERLLTAIINFENDSEMFFNATTTCCILLVDHSPKENIFFYNLQSISELKTLVIGAENEHSISISYNQIKASDKWRSYLYHEINNSYQNLVDISAFCKVTRGIATGANDYFCMNISKIKELGLPIDAFSECVCRSADVTSTIFTREDFKNLVNADKSAYVFDIKTTNDITVKNYIAKGEVDGISKKSLPAARNPWHSMEHRPIAPIWVSTACRNGLKFVRNLAGVKALTTFHSVYIHKEYEALTNIIFCYFLTPIAQEIIRGNRKELGNGLEKFQPNDINSAKMLDITKLSPADYNAINSIYKNMLNCFDDKYISKLNDIFSKHMF